MQFCLKKLQINEKIYKFKKKCVEVNKLNSWSFKQTKLINKFNYSFLFATKMTIRCRKKNYLN